MAKSRRQDQLVTPSPKRSKRTLLIHQYFDAVDNYDDALYPPKISPLMK